MGVIHVAAALVPRDAPHIVLVKEGLVRGAAGVAALQVGHGDVGVDAIKGPAGRQATVAAWLIVELALVTGVVVVAEDGAQVRGSPEHAGALLGALLGVGGHG